MNELRDWLINQQEKIVNKYRIDLHLEIEHTKKIYGNDLPPEVRQQLVFALRGIKIESMEKYNGNRQGAAEIYNQLHKPNFEKLLLEAIKTI